MLNNEINRFILHWLMDYDSRDQNPLQPAMARVSYGLS